jgi:predicted alpha/beta hydrolase
MISGRTTNRTPGVDVERQRQQLGVSTGDGVELEVEHVPAEGTPVGVVWCSHAMLADRRSLDRPRGAGLGSALAEHGLEVYLADLRGHGGSLRRSPGTRDWGYADVVEHDLPAITSFIRRRHPDLPAAGLGHSLSGHGALASPSVTDRLDALVTVATNVWLRELEPSPWRWLQKRAFAEMGGALAWCFGALPGRRLGIGSADASLRFVRDLRRSVRTSAWRGEDGTDHLAGLSRVTIPVLAVLGSGDALLCHPEGGARFHAPLPNAEVRLVDERDVGFRPGHMELVTDPRCRPLWHRIGRWLAARLLAIGARS